MERRDLVHEELPVVDREKLEPGGFTPGRLGRGVARHPHHPAVADGPRFLPNEVAIIRNLGYHWTQEQPAVAAVAPTT